MIQFLLQDPRLDVVLCFVDDAPPLAADEKRSEEASASAALGEGEGKGGEMDAGAWDLGEVGGFEAYLLAEDEDEVVDGKKGAADTYRQSDEESGVLNVSAASNSLNLVLRDEGLMRFVKFVSFLAPSSRYDLAMECVPEEDGEEEEGKEA